ncbi:hypothetical protein SAMN05421780_108154 [Flexibacter flexilis DSM 6793]|uniref:Uncharacterized protein n=1 Tax=Flexibacter flexilis DSM 6793 TaxID=927664 RepID=A0A1I1LHF6_9BACT|nr:hypothetical protein [Flexibacter flexilis]SFC70418.1 hypothetical protein SAMN05421780_108154 [Flexibacter flexilis DSM 6793]
MKKISLLLFVTIFTLLQSCNKVNETSCTSCMSENYSFVNIKFPNKTLNLRLFVDTLYNYSYLDGSGIKNLNTTNLVFDGFDLNKLIPNKDSIVMYSIYLDKFIKNQDSLTNNNFLGVLFYIKNKNKINTRLFAYKNSKLVEYPKYRLSSNYISSNDIYDIGIINFKKMHSFIGFMGNVIVPNNSNNKRDYLQWVIKRELNKINTPMAPGGGPVKYCKRPCESSAGDCKFYFFIQPPVLCANPDNTVCRINDVVHVEGNNHDDLLTNLYDFRDNVLTNGNNGQHYIDLYYQLSDRLPSERITYDFAVQTIDFIENVVLGMTTSLVRNPQAESVLYDDTKANIIINYLSNVKPLYEDDESRREIDRLIDDVRVHTNQSNAEITNYLNQ